MSTHSEIESTATETIARQIEHIKSKPVSVGGAGGYFVTKSKLDHIEQKLLSALEQSAMTSDSPSRLIELQEELNEIRDSSRKAQADLERTQATLKERTATFAKVARDRDTQQALAKSRLEEVERTHAQYREALAEAKKEREDSRALLATASKGFDPDRAQELQKSVESSTARIKDLQRDLELINADKKALNASFQEANAQLAALSSERTVLQNRINELLTTKNLASSDVVPEITVARPELNSKILQKMIGDRGINWLHKAEQQMVDDYRNRIYNLRLATKYANSPNVKSISDLLQIVLNWCKNKTWKARKIIASWVDMIEAHIRAGAVRSVKFYHDELRRISDEFDEQRAHHNVEPGQKLRWWEDAYFYAKVFYGRAKRSSKRTTSWFSRTLKKVGGFFSKLFGFQQSVKLEPEDFDAEELLKKEGPSVWEKGKMRAGTAPPPPPPPVPNKKVNAMAEKLAGLMGGRK